MDERTSVFEFSLSQLAQVDDDGRPQRKLQPPRIERLVSTPRRQPRLGIVERLDRQVECGRGRDERFDRLADVGREPVGKGEVQRHAAECHTGRVSGMTAGVQGLNTGHQKWAKSCATAYMRATRARSNHSAASRSSPRRDAR